MIGTATMLENGNVVLELRVDDAAGIGDARLEYAPTDFEFDEIIRHVGGLKPGETKMVPPWADEADEDDISDITGHEYDDIITAKPPKTRGR